MKLLSGIIALFMILASPAPVIATPYQETGKVYLVVADKLCIDDIDAKSTPNLFKLAYNGAVGLASNRTLGGNTTENGALTIGAGNLARSYGEGIAAYNAGEPLHGFNKPAGALYQALTGFQPDAEGCVLLNIPEIMAGMAKESTNTRLGSLGETLKSHGYKVCVVGNRDTGNTGDTKSRTSVAIAMDASGRVPLGDVSSRTTLTSASFLGLETDYEFLRHRISRYQAASDLIVVELSDLARLNNARTPFSEILSAEQSRLLKNMDDFIGELSGQLSSRDLLLVISPSPSKSQLDAKNTFTPVLAYGPGYKGHLTSGSTRRDFVVANTDIAPTVLSFFGIKDFGINIIGQPIMAKPASGIDALAQAQALAHSSALTNRLRSPLVKGYVVFQILVIVAALLWLTLCQRNLPILSALILAIGVVPLVLLPLGKISLPFDWAYGVLALIITVLLTAAMIVGCRANYYKAFILLSLFTLLALDIDILTGATMIKSSVLGYDPMAGARYYGVGNEYMGVIIGCAILVAAAIYQLWPRKYILAVLGVFLAGQALLISAPGLGANTDGVLTAPVAFLVTLMLMSDIRISLRNLALIATLAGGAVLALAAFDLSRPPELQSHVGRAAHQVIAGGWQEALIIIMRKASMNVKLMRYTVWSKVFLAILASLLILIYRPVGAMSRIKKDYPRLYQGFSGILTGAVVGLIVNDSGIVAAATTSIYVIAPVLLLIFSHNGESSEHTIC